VKIEKETISSENFDVKIAYMNLTEKLTSCRIYLVSMKGGVTHE
jgi:hypothetical protein